MLLETYLKTARGNIRVLDVGCGYGYLGIVIGVIGVAKILNILLNKFKTSVYSSSLGLLLASPFAIIYLTVKGNGEFINFSSPWIYIVGGLTLVLGCLFGFLMVYLEKKNEKPKQEAIETNNEIVNEDNNE